MTKYWRLVLRKANCTVTLFAMTSDEMLDTDLHGEEDVSLVRIARQYHRWPSTEEQNHRDLAIGALMAFTAEPPYDRDYSHIEVVLHAPAQAPAGYVGGGKDGQLVPIWEHDEAIEE